MFVVDDPMLALIARFIVDVDNLEMSNEEFLQQQVQSIKTYVSRYPPEQQSQKAMEWIEVYAKQYRADWQESVVSKRLTNKRCPDCPLIGHGSSSHCDVHQRWVDLLNNYMAEEITSSKYVEGTLKLMIKHKDRLKVSKVSEY